MYNKELASNSFDKGYIKIGLYRDNSTEKSVYFNPESTNDTGLLIVGKPGSGKNTYCMSNYFADVYNSKNSFVCIDYSDRSIPFNNDNVITIDLNKDCELLKLSFNEICFDKDKDSTNTGHRVMRSIRYKSELFFKLLNTVSNEIEVSHMQKKYFYSASIVCLASNPDATLKDIIDCLKSSEYRKQMIKAIPSNINELLSEYIQHLLTLDIQENQTSGDVSPYPYPNFNKICSLISKSESIKESPLLNKMFLNKSDTALDFEELFNKRKSILIKASSCITDHKYVKDFISMFFFLKTLTYCKNRTHNIKSQEEYKDLNRIHFLLNQEYNLTQTYKYLMECLPEMRILSMKPIILASNTNQLGYGQESIRKNINLMNSVGLNYMFLTGGIKQDFYELFKNQLSDYSMEDITSIKNFHSLNVVRDNFGYKAFITKLPRPCLEFN